MLIFLDIETCPSQNPQVREDIAASITHPGNISKQETIDKWNAESKPAAIEEAWLKTSFDGALGHICAIGFTVDNAEAKCLYSIESFVEKEASILRSFYKTIDDVCAERPNERPTFVGHNILEFDFKFMFQRSVILGVKPSRHIPFGCKPWDENVYDTMLRWGATRGGSLDKITKALGLGGKGDIDGSMVWPMVKEGRIAEVADYCKSDINLTRYLYKRMTFAEG